MEYDLVKMTNIDGLEHSKIVTSPSLEDALDAMFCSAYLGIHIRPIKEFLEEEKAKEKIERADDFMAYEIVENILSSEINDIRRLYLRLARGSSSVLLDNKVSKSICRFFFMTTKKKYITIPNSFGEHKKFIISTIDDIELYAKELRNALYVRIKV